MIQRHRKSLRRTWRPPFRRANRPGFRTRWRAPDDLAAGLTAFRRAIRAHRRLARLAPHHFDFAVVNRDRLELAERRRWQAVWEPDIEKVYGPPTPAEREARRHDDWLASQPPPLSPATQRAVDRHLADWKFWMAAGSQAWDRHRRRRPHELISWCRLARMLEIAFDFKRIATGLDSNQPVFKPHDDEAVWADLRRAYGHLDQPSAPATPKAPQAPAVAPQPPASSAPVQVTTPAASPPPPPSNSPPPPCNAYRRLARQLRLRHA